MNTVYPAVCIHFLGTTEAANQFKLSKNNSLLSQTQLGNMQKKLRRLQRIYTDNKFITVYIVLQEHPSCTHYRKKGRSAIIQSLAYPNILQVG